MSEPIVSRVLIAAQAERAALEQSLTGVPATNPYPFDTAAAAEWQVTFDRILAEHPEGEASA